MRLSLLCLALLAACGDDVTCGPVSTAPGDEPNTLISVAAPATLRKACSPYHLARPISVTADLTIEAGTKIVACEGGCRSRVTVGTNGRILANGTAADPVVFTSSAADSASPYGGQWTGILFLNALAGSHLNNVVLEYAGGPYSAIGTDDEFNRYEFPVMGSLLIDSTPDISVNGLVIRKSRDYAVAATTSEAFEDTAAGVFAAFEDVTVESTQVGMWIPLDQVGALGADVCFGVRESGGACPATPAPAGIYVEVQVDDNLGRDPESLRRDATWKPYNAPYLVETIDVQNDALLTIADGVELRMKPGSQIAVGLTGPGALSMVAAAPGGIVVRGVEDTPTMLNYWKGIYLWDQIDAARTRIENADIGYGGRGPAPVVSEAPALIGIYQSEPTIIGNHVHHSAGAGIHWNCLAEPAGLEAAPLPSTNTSEDSTIACAAAIGSGIAENFGCACPGGACSDRCPAP